MPRDIKELLNEGANPPNKGPNMDAIMRRSRTITWQRRAGAAAGVVALVAAAFLVGTQFAPDELTNANKINPAQSPDGNLGVVPTPGVVDPSETKVTEVVSADVTYEIWYHQGEMLVPASEQGAISVPASDDPGFAISTYDASLETARLAMTRLLEGPGSSDTSVALETSIPQGTKLLGVDIASGTATVDLNSEFASGGGSLSMQMRVAQVVYTLTQVPHIDSVVFEIEGERATSIGGEGIDVTQPQARQMYEQFMPPVLVDSPRRGDSVTSPLTVTGSANVFEATVQMRIVDESGAEIGPETFTTATCGTGCRGDYEGSIEFDVNEEQVAYVEVYSRSAEDGEPMFIIRIPVILLP